ncbi:MAG: hypothetical protein KBT02_08955 [Treponema sp.]|nr:hypothetical protein [Candidatus Treponema caballi]
MAQIDCTMDKLKFPNVASFQRTYGTRKMTNGGSLTTEEFNQNLFLPFDNDRPIIISENSSTSVIEYPAKFLMNTPNVTLTLGNGAYSGLEISVLVTVQGANKVTIAHGQTSDVVLGDSNRMYKYMWTGSFWFCSSIPTKGTIVSAKVVGTCETEGNEEEKDIYLTDYVDTVLPAEMTVHFTNKNTYGDTVATVPTHPICNIYNSNNVLLATLDVCDSRGHYAGEGCWNDGDDIDFKVSESKIRISNSDIRQSNSNMTIKADGSFVKSVTLSLARGGTLKATTDGKTVTVTITGFGSTQTISQGQNFSVGRLPQGFSPTTSIKAFYHIGGGSINYQEGSFVTISTSGSIEGYSYSSVSNLTTCFSFVI